MYNMRMKFEWHDDKNKSNQRKHKVSFEEAQSVFFDPLTLVATDPEHSNDEERFIAVGYSTMQRHLLVVHCYREAE